MSEARRPRPRVVLPARLALAGALTATAGLGILPAAALAETPIPEAAVAPGAESDPPAAESALDGAPLPDSEPAADPASPSAPDSSPVSEPDPATDPVPVAQDPDPVDAEIVPEILGEPMRPAPRVATAAVDPATVVAVAEVDGDGKGPWYRGAVTVTVSAPPEALGTSYRIDGGPWVEQTDTLDATFTISAKGSHTVSYRALVVDPVPPPTLQASPRAAAAIGGPVGTLTVGIDTDAPSITGLPAALRGSSPVFTVGQRVRFEYRCGDALSGVVTCDSAPKAGGFLDTASPGRHTARITARDAAGNTTVRTVRYRVLKKSQAPVEPTRPPVAQPSPNDDSDELALTGGGGTGPGPVIAALAAVLGAGTLLGGVGSVRRGR